MFIRSNIAEKTSDVIKKTRKDVSEIIEKKINSILPEQIYNELVNLGVLGSADIRMPGSSLNSVIGINNEISYALLNRVLAYIEEAKKRLSLYIEAKKPFEEELKKGKETR